MKHNILYSLFLAGILASCNSDEEAVKTNPDYIEPGYGALTVTLKNDASLTRAIGDELTGVATTEEKTIKSVAFFINTETVNGKPGAFGSYFSDEATLTSKGFMEPLKGDNGTYQCRVMHRSDGWGNPQVIVIANYADNDLTAELKAVSSWKGLEDVMTKTLAENPATPLLMYCAKTITSWEANGVNDGGGSVTEEFKMERLVSRIDIHNLAYNTAEATKGFELQSAQLVRPRVASFLLPMFVKEDNPAVSATPFKAITKIDPYETDYQMIEGLYAYENPNTAATTATAVQVNGLFRGSPVSKIVDFKKQAAGVAVPIALARNYRYVINILPIDSTDIKWDITVKEWTEADTIKVKPEYAKPEVAFEAFAANGSGATWTAGTKTLNITNATATGGTLTFTASGENIPDVKMVTLYDTDASSIGGTATLVTKEEAILPYAADGKITRKFTINVPIQTDEKVPLDLKIYICNSQNEANIGDSILITSRPDYTDTKYPVAGLKPVLVAGRYWAPVNVGANTLDGGTTSAGMGYYFQHGRNDFPISYLQDCKANAVEGPVTWEEATGIYANRFIKESWLSPDDPKYSERDASWHPEINNSPCPKGWRVPTNSDFEALLAVVKSKDVKDAGNNRLSLVGDDGATLLYFPRTGYLNAKGDWQSLTTQARYWGGGSPRNSEGKFACLFLNPNNASSIYMDTAPHSYVLRCVQH